MAYESERKRMIDAQLIPRGISDARVLDVFRKVPRHEFAPKNLLNEAYADYPLPIGEGQTISQPYIVALMTERLKLRGGEKVLEVGTGSGYQTAILAELAGEVYSVERARALAKKASDTLDRLGCRNIKIKIGDGTLGWEENSPYDAIIVTAGAPNVPDPLIRQLDESGRLVIPIGGSLGQTLTLIEKKNGKIIYTEICGCMFVPLVGKEGWKDSLKN
ncbi:MAG: protein-L-isoaspartate(D-aspartate) O-methyltransferase [Candidatus Omnitrophica bacterium]|nr:protein-L-isoaspartate(D-aspartate) O-methyltransferase [Candidatus Omnitrophota bacterium]